MPNISGSQATGKYVPAPRLVVELLDLSEIRERWGFGEDRIYRAVAHGRLHAYGRPNRQKYYSAAELIRCFGEPTNGPAPRSRKMKDAAKGGNPQRFNQQPKFDFARAA